MVICAMAQMTIQDVQELTTDVQELTTILDVQELTTIGGRLDKSYNLHLQLLKSINTEILTSVEGC